MDTCTQTCTHREGWRWRFGNFIVQNNATQRVIDIFPQDLTAEYMRTFLSFGVHLDKRETCHKRNILASAVTGVTTSQN